jgi:hypothetical protein
MIRFMGAVTLEDDTPATIGELIYAAVLARNYGNNAARLAQAERFLGGTTSRESIINPKADIYVIDAYKGVKSNGVVDQTAWTLPTDITDSARQFIAEVTKHVEKGLNLNEVIFYQASGVAVTVELDIAIV